MTTQVYEPVRPETQAAGATLDRLYEYEDTQALVDLVADAAKLVVAKGEDAFADFRAPAGRWRRGETYIFVLDEDGNMLVHADSSMEGTNQLELKDITGKPIVRGLLGAAPVDKPEGWYHYQWPVPSGLLPRWKSSFVRRVVAPSGKSYVVGAGMYDDRMERAFVVDLVTAAVHEIEKKGDAAYALFRDPAGPFIAKDAYIFVINPDGVEVVNPAHPNLEGRQLLDVKDTEGKAFTHELFATIATRGSGWVDYMWPKPGDNVSTRKSAYVTKAALDDKWVLVGSGVYLADAPKAARPTGAMSAPELIQLVREAAAVFEQRGEAAFPEFRQKGSKWFRDDTYFWACTEDGTRVLHAGDPALEGQSTRALKDILGRPIGEMILDAAASPTGEEWIHYLYPRPAGLFPVWKSTFVKRVTFPSGERRLVGCGIYNMQMDRAFIEEVVNRAASLIERLGRAAFPQLRDRKGPFVFMDTYVFVNSTDGVELVNPAQPTLEGRNLMELRDLKGKSLVRDEIAAALKDGPSWVECYWYRPGDNVPARKLTLVRRVQHGADTFIVGSGMYVE
jgi:signal transduction histidine kinase